MLATSIWLCVMFRLAQVFGSSYVCQRIIESADENQNLPECQEIWPYRAAAYESWHPCIEHSVSAISSADSCVSEGVKLPPGATKIASTKGSAQTNSAVNSRILTLLIEYGRGQREWGGVGLNRRLRRPMAPGSPRLSPSPVLFCGNPAPAPLWSHPRGSVGVGRRSRCFS